MLSPTRIWSTVKLPEVGIKMPFRFKNRVDLPAPFEPMKAHLSPFFYFKINVFKGLRPVWVLKAQVLGFNYCLHNGTVAPFYTYISVLNIT